MIDMSAGYLQDEVTTPSRINIYSSPSWNYFCYNMQEIIPGVFLGPHSAAEVRCLNNLREKGIRYIICVRQEAEAHFIRPQINDPTFTYLTLDIIDHETENILRFFPQVNRFIDEALSRNFKVLVHGNTGNSRSATLVLAYIMQKFGMAVSEALCFAKSKRESIDPNKGFRAQLLEYEPIYKANQNLIIGGSSSTVRLRPKRKLEQLSEAGSDYSVVPSPPSPISYDSNGTYILASDRSVVPPPPSPVPYDSDEADTKSPSASEFSNHLYMLWLAKR